MRFVPAKIPNSDSLGIFINLDQVLFIEFREDSGVVYFANGSTGLVEIDFDSAYRLDKLLSEDEKEDTDE